TIRGTSDQRGRSFGLRHVIWLAGIELGMTNAADRNRTVLLEMKLPKGNKPALDLSGEDALAELGLKLLALGVRHAHEADRLAQRLKSRDKAGVPQRIVECTPALTCRSGSSSATPRQRPCSPRS